MTDLARHMGAVAAELLGEPDKHLSNGHGCSRNPVERDSLGRELELLAEQAEGAR